MWVSAEAFDTITDYCRAAGITKTAWLEATADWMNRHPFQPAASSRSEESNAVLLRARQLTAESRQRDRGQ